MAKTFEATECSAVQFEDKCYIRHEAELYHINLEIYRKLPKQKFTAQIGLETVTTNCNYVFGGSHQNKEISFKVPSFIFIDSVFFEDPAKQVAPALNFPKPGSYPPQVPYNPAPAAFPEANPDFYPPGNPSAIPDNSVSLSVQTPGPTPNPMPPGNVVPPSSGSLPAYLQALQKPTTVGTHRLDINSILETNKLPQTIQWAIEGLKARGYMAWRKVAGDGNTFYRAVGVSYLEYLARPSTDLNLLRNFSLEMVQPMPMGIYTHVNPASRNTIYEVLIQLTITRNTRGNALLELQTAVLRPEFDSALIACMRGIAYGYLSSHRNEEGLAEFISCFSNEELLEIFQEGIEAEQLAMISLARALSTCLRTIELSPNMNPSINYTTVYGPLISGVFPHISMVFVNRHFDMLYTQRLNDADGYVYETNSFNPREMRDSPESELYNPTG